MIPRFALGALIFVLVSGCGKQKIDATVPLQQSFQKADPQVKQSIDTVNANLKSGNYEQALKTLTPVVKKGELSPEQRQAVGAALQQVTTAAADNPALNTAQM